jgi:4-cresol dehydrogenase (hydroxylating)
MFCQSSFGVATQLAFKLIAKPESRYIIWGTTGDESLERLADEVDRFASQSLINRGASNIGYGNRFVQAQQTLAGGTEPPVEWNWYVLASGTKRVARTIADEILERLAPLCTTTGAFHVGAADRDHDAIDKLPPFLKPLASPLLGLPDTSTIKTIYQLTGTPLPTDDRNMDADQTPFGMKTCIVIVPPKSAFVRQAAEIVAEVRRKHALNTKASFFGDGRTLITIHFRNDIPDQVQRAAGCENEVWDRLLAAGFGCYRASIDQMPRLIDSRPEFFRLVSELKAALDPNGIISPGRYAPLR